MAQASVRSQDIQPAPPGSISWDAADPIKSLANIRLYVDGVATAGITWYWTNKRWKSHLSRFIQFSAVVLTAAAALVPVIAHMWKANTPSPTFDSGLWASLFVGLAAALIGLDKAFGFSSGWARYVLTATSIQKALEEFRLDWMILSAGLSQPPKPEQVTALIQRAKEFVSSIAGMVLQETKDWVSEFQSSMAQIEKDVKAQLDTLTAQVQKAAQPKDAASRPGSVELTVEDADKTDGFEFHVTLVNETGKLADETVTRAKSWRRINLAPGQYSLTLTATVGGKPVAAQSIVEIKPGEITKSTVMFSAP
ncbi:MAG TPA: SLATT domain-containing protein [Terriglobia bacterium]|nr:SLATT domain-containing protein [Terriglobia bacterium]